MALDDKQKEWAQHEVFGSGDEGEGEGGESSGEGTGETTGGDGGADFYEQTFQADGYTLGTDSCLDRCWAEFKKCCNNNSTSGGLECLAQLNACRERCGSVASTQPSGEGTGEETGEGKGTDEATGGAAGEGTDGGTGEGSAGAAQIVFQAGVREQSTGHPHAGQNLQLRWESLNVGTARSGAFTSKLEVWPTTTDLGGVCIEPSGDPAYSTDVDEDDLGPGESHEKNETAPTTTAGWYYIRVTLNGGVSTTNCVEVLERE